MSVQYQLFIWFDKHVQTSILLLMVERKNNHLVFMNTADAKNIMLNTMENLIYTITSIT